MKKTKKLIEESILLAIDSISQDIRHSIKEDENNIRAESIKVLSEAYDTVHRGGKRE